MNQPPRMRNVITGTVHAVRGAAGGPADGSLHGFYLYCGTLIDLVAAPDKWQEESADKQLTCLTCARSVHADAKEAS